MSVGTLAVRTVTVQSTVTTTDRYNNEIRDWTSPVETASQAWISQTSTSEDHEHRDGIVTILKATFPLGVAWPGPYDRVVVDGTTYEIEGRPVEGRTPRGLHHLEVELRTVAG